MLLNKRKSLNYPSSLASYSWHHVHVLVFAPSFWLDSRICSILYQEQDFYNAHQHTSSTVGCNLCRSCMLLFFAIIIEVEVDFLTSDKDTFETLQTQKSKWTPPEGQFASLDFFINKCHHDVNKLNFNCNTKFSNLSSEERAALQNLRKRKDIVVKWADKGGTLVVWWADLYQKEALRQLSDTSFYAKVDKDLTSTNQQIVKSTINNLISNKNCRLPLPVISLLLLELCVFTSYLKFTNLTTQACSCPTELISSYLDKIMAPIVRSLPSYVKDRFLRQTWLSCFCCSSGPSLRPTN